ncbi:MAG: hypothetical protein IPI53_03285 [Saprospiraceae bacterium]|nr:hypothetical protein [Saprospiraceae bacterium]
MSGTYTVTVTDNKGCSGTSSVSATVNPSLNVSTAAPGGMCRKHIINLIHPKRRHKSLYL